MEKQLNLKSYNMLFKSVKLRNFELNIDKQISFSLLAGVFWILGLINQLIFQGSELLYTLFFVASLFFGGYYVFKELLKDINKNFISIDLLMIMAALGSALLGNWNEAALLIFLFSLGIAFENYALSKAKGAITGLDDLLSKKAFVKSGQTFEEKNIEDLLIGDIVLCKPNSKISADGYITNGSSTIDQSPITGESIPVTKTAISKNFTAIQEVNKVYAGSINGNSKIEIRVTSMHKDNTLSSLIRLVSEVQAQKSTIQLVTEKFERYYVPIVLTLVCILPFAFIFIDEPFSNSFNRSIGVLIGASPCALAISTPSAILAAIAKGAKSGIIIKGGSPLEILAKINAIAFDKTGTLTEGNPKLKSIIPLNNFPIVKLKQLVIAIESCSDHPIAAAIVNELIKQVPDSSLLIADEVKSITGKGITGKIDSKVILIGNRKLISQFSKNKLSQKEMDKLVQLESSGQTAMIVLYDNQYVGLLGVMDTPRQNSSKTIERLKSLDINKLIMLSGDNQNVVNNVASEIGLSNAKGDLLPADKVKEIRKLQTEGYTIAMVGDGVNDAPALAVSNIGIAMGAAGSDVALKTADVALLGDKIENLFFLIQLGRETRKIIIQNIIISLGMVIILVPITFLQLIPIGAAVIGHEGSTILVVLNALRLLKFKI